MLVEEGFASTRPGTLLTPELESRVGSETNCTSGPADVAADGKGCENGLAFAAAEDCQSFATFNNACDTVVWIEIVRVDTTSAKRVICIVAWAASVGSCN